MCGIWSELLVWLIGTVVCLLTAPQGQLSAVQYYQPVSCQFRDCKILPFTSLTYVKVKNMFLKDHKMIKY